MKLGAVPNLSSLTELPLLLERVWGQRPGREWAGPGGEEQRHHMPGWSVCFTRVAFSLLSCSQAPPPPRHWQERNRKGRAKISVVVVGWLDWQDYIHCLDNCPGRPEQEGAFISFSRWPANSPTWVFCLVHITCPKELWLLLTILSYW